MAKDKLDNLREIGFFKVNQVYAKDGRRKNMDHKVKCIENEYSLTLFFQENKESEEKKAKLKICHFIANIFIPVFAFIFIIAFFVIGLVHSSVWADEEHHE